MDTKDDISASRAVLWSNDQSTLEEVEEKYGFPQILKMTTETSRMYDLPEEEPIMIYGRRNLTRTIAHTIEEGDYVMGRQLEISNEFFGSFKLSSELERNEVPLKTFSTVQEIASYFPAKVYVQDILTIRNEDNNGKPSTTVLLKGDELTLISRVNLQPQPTTASKPASRFVRPKQSNQQIPGLSFHSTRLNTSISLPLTCKGNFATRTPIESNVFERTREMPLEQIIECVNFPITVKVANNRSRSPKDEFTLRSGMHLKLIGVENHYIMLGVAPFNRIIELSPSSGFYYVPCALTQPKENEVDCNQYKTYLQNAYMASKIQSSATNIDDYCKSVRFHTPRNKRVTNPKPWNRNFNLRTQNQRSSRKPQPRGISAIQLISNQPVPRARPTFQNKNHVTRALPIPDTGHATSAYPPLPPRNNPLFSVAPENSNVPPVPPKMRPHSMYVEKAPPPPDMPARPPPLPSSHSSVSEDHLEFHTRPLVNDESIWEVWGPAGSQVVDSSKHNASPGSSQNSLNELTKEVSNENNSSLHEVEQFDNEQLRVDSPLFPIENKTKSSPVQKSRTSSAYENTEIQFKPVQTESDEATQDAEATQLVNLSNDVVNENEDQTMMGLDRKSKIYENLKEALLKQKQDDINESPLHNGYEDTTVPKICFNNEDGTIVSKDSAADLSSQRRNSIDGSSATQARPVKQYVLPPEDWVPPDNPETMTVNDVSYALRFIGLSEDIVEHFHNERIDGQILTELNIDILTNDFYLSQLHRFKISRFLEGWRPKLS